MLRRLINYAHDQGLETEPGFKPKDVRWALCFTSQGEFLKVIQELGEVGSKRNPGQHFAKCPDLSQPELTGGATARAHFLIETAEIMALFGKNASERKAREKHHFFVELLRRAGSVMPELGKLGATLTNDKALAAIRDCMNKQDNPKVKSTDRATFRVDGRFPVESSAWHGWWHRFRKALASERSGDADKPAPTKGGSRMRCFITGELVEPAATHPKIEGLADVGGQPSGTSLIGYDKEAFASYGLEQSANAAVSEEAASAYRIALNELLRNQAVRLAGAKVVYWFKGKVAREDDPLAWLQEGAERQELDAQHRARTLLEAIRNGKRPELLDNAYYALALSGSGGRVMVRDWMEGQFENLAENVFRWFEDLAIVNVNGSKLANSPGIGRVVTSLLPPLKPGQKYIDWIKPVGAERLALWHAAVRGDPIPHSALTQAVVLNTKFHVTASLEEAEKQNRNVPATLSLLYTRMGLMKAYHNRKKRTEGGKQMASDMNCFLNEEHPHPAYHCGRLMAVLAALQRSALGDVGAGVVQRYYAAASATPALVLGRLTRTSQFHLNKLDPGLAHWYENRIADIWCRIKDAVPSTLDLEEQSIFALGYYQQIASRRPDRSTGLSDEKNEEENRE